MAKIHPHTMETSSIYPLVFDTVGDPLLVVDGDGRVIMANAAASTFFDFNDSKHISAVTCFDGAVRFNADEIIGLMNRYDSVRGYVLDNSDGGASHVSLDVEPVRGATGEPVCKLLHFRNAPSRVQSDVWKDELISMVSHEIKNPLSAMKNSVDILLSQMPGQLTEGQKRFLCTSGRNIDRLTQLLDGFLNVSRIRAGAFELDRGWTKINEFVAEVMSEFRATFNVNRVKLDWSVDPAVSEGYIDKAKVEQVLTNLLGNAVKYTPERGTVRLTVTQAGVESMSEDLRLLPWTELGAPRILEFIVSDSGIGMTSETLEHLFVRYHRGDAHPAQGSHLGLNISKTLVEAQNGWMEVDSQLGIGTQVRVYLPQNQNTACMLRRLGQAKETVARSIGRPLTFVALGKANSERWDDIVSAWQRDVLVNPERLPEASGEIRLWTISESLAFGLVLDAANDEGIESLFGEASETEPDSHVMNGISAGMCRVPAEGQTFAQMCNIAVTRMREARRAVVASLIDTEAADLACLVNEWGADDTD